MMRFPSLRPFDARRSASGTPSCSSVANEPRSRVVPALKSIPVEGALEPMALTLERTSNELRDVARLIGALEDVVGKAIESASITEDFNLQEIQLLDHIRQKIAGAAEFLAALTDNMPLDWMIDAKSAAAALTLSELATHLGSGGVGKSWTPS